MHLAKQRDTLLLPQSKATCETDAYGLTEPTFTPGSAKGLNGILHCSIVRFSSIIIGRCPVMHMKSAMHPLKAHQNFVWAIRKNPRVRRVWELLLGDNDLLSSFDGICVMKAGPVRNRATRLWVHTDQGPRKIGLHCIQGLVNLTDVDFQRGTLMVREGSHRLHEEVMNAVTKPGDWHVYSAADLAAIRQGGTLIPHAEPSHTARELFPGMS